MAAGRRRRHRAERLQAVASWAVLVPMFGSLAAIPDSPLAGVVFLVAAVGLVAAGVVPHREGEWERRHVLRVATAGLGAMLAWQLGEVAWWYVQEGHRPSPGRPLTAAAGGIMVAHVVLRQLSLRLRTE